MIERPLTMVKDSGGGANPSRVRVLLCVYFLISRECELTNRRRLICGILAFLPWYVRSFSKLPKENIRSHGDVIVLR